MAKKRNDDSADGETENTARRRAENILHRTNTGARARRHIQQNYKLQKELKKNGNEAEKKRNVSAQDVFERTPHVRSNASEIEKVIQDEGRAEINASDDVLQCTLSHVEKLDMSQHMGIYHDEDSCVSRIEVTEIRQRLRTQSPLVSDGDPLLQTETAEPTVTKGYTPQEVIVFDPSHIKRIERREHVCMSALQQHVSFFDRNKDGIVYPWETYQGFRAIGFGFFISLAAAFIINILFSYSTQQGWIPSPRLPIYIRNIHKCKHGSDSESFDTQGRFDSSKFDSIFSKYALTHPDALTSEELTTMLRVNRNFADFIGWVISWAEWQLLYLVGKDGQGLLHREFVQGVYDGNLFEQLEERTKTQKMTK